MEEIDKAKKFMEQLLWGGYPEDGLGGLVPSWNLYVFVSSTFTDTKRERNELSNILKELSVNGDKHGIVVIFIDLRWGIPGVASLEHKTWMTCKRELERCRDQSNGLFFLSLQSEKYINIFWLLTLYINI